MRLWNSDESGKATEGRLELEDLHETFVAMENEPLRPVWYEDSPAMRDALGISPGEKEIRGGFVCEPDPPPVFRIRAIEWVLLGALFAVVVVFVYRLVLEVSAP